MSSKGGGGIEGAIALVIVAGAVAGAFAIFAAFIAIPLFIVALGYFGWRAYDHYQNSATTLERKARERTHALYLEAQSRMSFPDKTQFGKQVARHLRINAHDEALGAAIEIALDVYDLERFGATLPDPPAKYDSIEGARYRDFISKLSAVTPQDVDNICKAIGESLNPLLAHADVEDDPEAAFVQPLHTLIPEDELGDTVEKVALPYFRESVRHHFPTLRADLERNLQAAGGDVPSDYKGGDVAELYLRGTPFLKLFETPLPIHVPRHIRHEHAIITGGSGHGKTTLLENLILKDIKDSAKPSIVVIDSQRALIGKLSRLALVHERPLIIIDPKDAPALNPFAFNQARYATYGEEGRERVRNHTMELFGYLFDSLLGADLTTRQGAMFTYMIQVMLAMPETMGRNATLEDVIRFTEAPEDYARAIDALQPIAKTFFATDFLRPRYNETREQVRYRLHAILGNTTIARLFLARENKVDFFEELNQGAIILIDTDKGFLGAKNSAYLGRIAITLLLQAILERDASGKPHREVFAYIDEAGEYFDKSIESFLTEARKQLAGVTLAHQHFAQMTTELRSSVATNTATKYAGGLFAQDARSAAQDMRAEVDFLMNQERLNFACYIRNVTKTPTTVQAKIGLLAKEQQATEADYQAFRKRNKERMAAPPVIQAQQAKPEEKPKRRKSKLETDPGEYA